jgi:hypothetical protein
VSNEVSGGRGDVCVETGLPHFTYPYETEPACNGKEFQSLQFHYRQVSLYMQVTPLLLTEY